MRVNVFALLFVEYVPLELEEGFLYISMKYATATHLCACGCKQKVITPISPNAWSLWFDGVSVTLSPSIGNYEQDCYSHYFIRKNRVVWCTHHRNEVASSSKKNRKNKRKWFKFGRKRH